MIGKPYPPASGYDNMQADNYEYAARGASSPVGVALARPSSLENLLNQVQGLNGQLHEQHRRLSNIADKVIGYGPEEPMSDLNEKDTNGAIDSIMQALKFQQKLIDRLGVQIDRLQTL